jgi:hypothetical protein
LHGNNITPLDDLGDEGDGSPVALWRVVRRRFPCLVEATERPQVPCSDDQVRCGWRDDRRCDCVSYAFGLLEDVLRNPRHVQIAPQIGRRLRAIREVVNG